jgi:acylphosphatase
MPEIAVKLRIHGKVQGVWYRDWTVQAANALGVHGWVRNRTNGTVEALVVGEEAAVRSLIAQCHQGSPASHVERIDETPAQGIVSRDGFVRKPTV